MARSTFVSPEPSNLELRYHHYLRHSWRWRIIRVIRLWADGYRCQTCHATGNVQAHHASYKNLAMGPVAWLFVWSLILELLDTICLCRECHERLHRGRSILDFAD